VGPGIPQRQCHFFARTIHEKWSNCFDGTESHARRRARGENTEDEFFPEQRVTSLPPDLAKLIESRSYLFLSRFVCCAYVVNDNGVVIASHWIVNAQILGFCF
jgi:hypothetical protein